MQEKKWSAMAKAGERWPILKEWLDEKSWFKTSNKWNADPKCEEFARIYNWFWSPDCQELRKVCDKPRQFFASSAYAIPDGHPSLVIPSTWLCRLLGYGFLEEHFPAANDPVQT